MTIVATTAQAITAATALTPGGSAADAAGAGAGAAEGGGFDFAALLQARTNPTVAALAPLFSGQARESGEASVSETATDPNALFAALGLPVPIATEPSSPAMATEAGALSGAATATDPAIAALLAAQIQGLTPPPAKPAEPRPDLSDAEAARDDVVLAGSASPHRGGATRADAFDAPAIPDVTQAATGNAPTAKPAAGDEFASLLHPNRNESAIAAAGTTHAAPPASAPSRTEATPHVATPLQDREWAGEFGQKVVWMASNDRQLAQLTLNPPQLGPIEISLNISNDQATAAFVSPHAEVREAIENALPRLREMLAGAGIELGQAHVGAESFQQQADGRQATPRGDRAGTPGIETESRLASESVRTANRSGSGLVDTFA